MPVSSRTTKLYSANSPHRNEKWFGNTLRSVVVSHDPVPVRDVTEST